MQEYRKSSATRGLVNIHGFTLLEILLTGVMLTMIAMAVYTTFNNGLDLWKTMNRDVVQENITIFFSKISKDLRNSFRHSAIQFCGERDKIVFACPVKLRLAEKEELVSGIGEVEYSFDERTKTINRVQSNYSQLYLDKAGPVRQVTSNIKSLNLQYYCFDPREEEYLWVGRWNEQETPLEVKTDEQLPLAVKIEVETDDNGKKWKFIKIVTIPVAGK